MSALNGCFTISMRKAWLRSLNPSQILEGSLSWHLMFECRVGEWLNVNRQVSSVLVI